MRSRLILLFLAGVMAAAPAAAAQGRGNGRGGGAAAERSNNGIGAALGGEVEVIIRAWFSDSSNLKGLPPGLAKKEQLPPGLQRQLARNGKLPPGLEKQLQPLPPQLVIQLPRLPVGRRYITIGGNVILLDETTSTIIDILTRVF